MAAENQSCVNVLFYDRSKCPEGKELRVPFPLDGTVSLFKRVLGERLQIEVEQQRLIYKGKILKDDNVLEGYGLKADNIPSVHLVMLMEKEVKVCVGSLKEFCAIHQPSHMDKINRCLTQGPLTKEQTRLLEKYPSWTTDYASGNLLLDEFMEMMLKTKEEFDQKNSPRLEEPVKDTSDSTSTSTLKNTLEEQVKYDPSQLMEILEKVREEKEAQRKVD